MEEERMGLVAQFLRIHLRIWTEVVSSGPMRAFGSATSELWVDVLYHVTEAGQEHFSLMIPKPCLFRKRFQHHALATLGAHLDEMIFGAKRCEARAIG